MSNVSRPLEIIESEINFYKQQTATGIIEIGKRLIEAKAQLPHGEWGRWLEEKVEFSERTAQRFMKVANEFPTSMSYLGTGKLFKLLDIPYEERQQFIVEKHEVNGKEKTVEEMTTRELQAAIKAKRELEEKLKELEESKKKSDEHYQSMLNIADGNRIKAELELRKTQEESKKSINSLSKTVQDLQQKLRDKPIETSAVKIIEKPVVPDDYEQIKKEKQQLVEQNKTLLEQKQQLARQLQESRVLQSEIINLEEFRQNVGYFLEKMAKYTFYSEAFATLDKRYQTEFLKQVEKIDIWVTEVKQAIKGQKSEKTIIFEGGFISE